MSTSKANTLQRLFHIYALIEAQKAASLSRSTSALRNVEQELEAQNDWIVHMGSSSVRALIQEERSEWLLCESERECSIRNVTALQVVRRHRQGMRDDALQQYSASLLKKDQMKSALDAVKASLENTQRRREQLSLDDRFIARSIWIRTKERRRINLR